MSKDDKTDLHMSHSGKSLREDARRADRLDKCTLINMNRPRRCINWRLRKEIQYGECTGPSLRSGLWTSSMLFGINTVSINSGRHRNWIILEIRGD